MAAGVKSAPAPNGTQSSLKSIELAISLPHNPGTRIHLRLDVFAASIMLFLTSANAEGGQGSAALGSFVYAMPDRYHPSQPMSTPLYHAPTSVDFATRMSKVLARKTKMPCYVGSSVSLAGVGGGSVEEEMEAFRAVVGVVTTAVERAGNGGEDT